MFAAVIAGLSYGTNGVVIRRYVTTDVSVPAMLMVLPIATWEMSVGIYMTFKGFRTSQVNDDQVVEPVVPVALAQV